MTINQLCLILENTIKNHLQIADYYYGDVLNINSRDNNYVLFNYYTDGFELGDNMSNVSFSFYIFDKLKEDESNLRDIQSDLTQIMNDIIFSIKYNYEYFIDVKSVSSYEFFKDKFTDYLAGITTSVSIEIKNNAGNCDIPLLSGNTIHLTSYDYTLGYNAGYMDGLEQSGTISHNVLTDRSLSDQHPIGAITGLQNYINLTNSSLTNLSNEISLIDISNLENDIISLSATTINLYNSDVTINNNISSLSSYTYLNINSLNISINNLNNSAITNLNNTNSLSSYTYSNISTIKNDIINLSSYTNNQFINVYNNINNLNNSAITNKNNIISLSATSINLSNQIYNNTNNINILSGAGFITNTNDYLDFNAISGISYKKGRVFFDNVEDALSYYNSKSELTMQIGRELWVKVRNITGSQINNGQAVYVNSSYNDIATIELADCKYYNKSRIIGIATMNIPSDVNGFGYVTFFGRVNNVDTSTFSLGSVLYLREGFPGELTITTPTDGCFKTRVGIVTVVSSTVGSIEVNISPSEYTVEVLSETGFPDDSLVSMTFVNSARTFAIQPSSTEYRYYEKGEKYIKTAKDELVISDVEGSHLIYFNGTTLNELVNGTSAQVINILSHYSTCIYIYWNFVDKKAEFIGKELHNSIGYGVNNHIIDHLTVGAKYATGLNLNNINSAGNGDVNSHAQFGVDAGSIYDEDILHSINAVSATTGYIIRYTSDTNLPRSIRFDGMPVMTGGTGRIVYNPSGSNLVEVTNTNYVWYHLFASGELNNSNTLCTFVGRNQYTSDNLAFAGLNSDIASVQNSGLPSPEFKAIASILFQTNNVYTNLVKARIRPANTDGANFIDWRRLTIAGGGVGSGGGTVAQTVFSDTEFKLYDNTDITKELQFNLDGLSSGLNTVNITKSGTVAMLSDLTGGTIITGSTSGSVTGITNQIGYFGNNSGLTSDSGLTYDGNLFKTNNIVSTNFVDNSDNNKKINLNLSNITSGQNRTINLPDRNLDLDNNSKTSLGISIYGNNNIITVGSYGGYFKIPYGGTIIGWNIVEGSVPPISTTCLLDVYKSSTFYPTSGDTIFNGSNNPLLTASTNNSNNSLNISFTSDDYFTFYLNTNNNAKVLNIQLNIIKS